MVKKGLVVRLKRTSSFGLETFKYRTIIGMRPEGIFFASHCKYLLVFILNTIVNPINNNNNKNYFVNIIQTVFFVVFFHNRL